jgi:hypothetical protein
MAMWCCSTSLWHENSTMRVGRAMARLAVARGYFGRAIQSLVIEKR